MQKETERKGTERKYQIKTKRVLISKEQKTDIKKKKTKRRAEFDRNPSSQIIQRIVKKNYEELN